MQHSFDISLAAKYSMEEALIIHHIQHWVRVNYKNKRNRKEERTWTYQSMEEIASHFPYLTARQVKHTINKLRKKGVLIAKNFNKSKIDKTLWYAFADEKAFGVDPESLNNLYERQNCPSMDKIVLREDKIVQPIPDTKNTDTETSKKKNINVGTPKVPYREHVYLTENEYLQICSVYGDWAERGLDILEAYKSSNGKPYKEDFAVFKKGGWIHDKFLLEKSKIPVSMQDKPPKPPTQEDLILNRVTQFVNKNWSVFQADHLTPFIEHGTIYFEDRKGKKFSEKCFTCSITDSDFEAKLNKFLDSRGIKIIFKN
jgi:hypothetical protein